MRRDVVILVFMERGNRILSVFYCYIDVYMMLVLKKKIGEYIVPLVL